MDAVRLLALVDDIYRAGENPAHWPVVLSALGAELRSSSTILRTQSGLAGLSPAPRPV